jgi:HEAT repeats
MKRVQIKQYCGDVRLPVWMLRLVGILLVLGAQGVTPCRIAVSASRVDSPTLRVSARDGLLSVEAQAAPWVQVLDEVSRKTGTHFRLFSPLPGSVTIAFKELPAEQALRRLFGPNTNYVLRFPESNAQSVSPDFPSEVWVLGRGSGKIFETSDDKGNLAPEATENTSDPGQEGEKEDRAELLAALDALKADDPARRMQALSFLCESGKADERTVLSALEAALADEDASVRGQAIQTLATRGDPEVMKYLWQALRDPDPSVRTMLIDSVVPQGPGFALLQTALSDADETVRTIAAFRLKQGRP